MSTLEEEISAIRAEEAAAVDDVGVEIEAVRKQVDDEDNGLLRSSFESSLGTNADRKSKVLALARATRLDSNVVDANFEQFDATWRAAQTDPAKWKRDNPELSRMILENPGLRELVPNDNELHGLTKVIKGVSAMFSGPYDAERKVRLSDFSAENLGKAFEESRARISAAMEPTAGSAIEQPLPGPEFLPNAVRAAYGEYTRSDAALKRSQLGADILQKRMLGIDTWELDKQVNDMERDEVPVKWAGDGPLMSLGRDIGQTLPSIVSSVKAGGVGAAVGGAVGAIASRGSPQGAVAGARLGAMITGRAMAAAQSFVNELGGSYLDIRNTKTDDGEFIADKTAIGTSILYSLAATGVEVATLPVQLKAFGPVGEAALTGNLKAKLLDVAQNKSKAEIFSSVVKAWGKSAIAESAEEVVQESTQIGVTHAAKMIEAGSSQRFDTGEALTRIGEAGGTAFVGIGGLGTLSAAVNVGTAMVASNRARAAGEVIKSVASFDGKKSPSNVAAPEAVANAVKQAAAAGGVNIDAMYLDVAATEKYFQGQDIDPAEAVRSTFGEEAARNWVEAKVSGSKLRIPLDAYLEKFGGSEAAKALAGDTAIEPLGMTPNEEQKLDLEKAAQELAKTIESEPMTAKEDAYVGVLRKSLRAQNQYSDYDINAMVSIHRAFVRTLSKRTGVNADALFQDKAVLVRAASSPLEVRLTPEEFLTQRAAKLTPAERVVEVFTDRNTGLPNAKGFARINDPARPMFGTIAVEGIAWLNDKDSHDKADLLYRTVARVAHPLSTTIAKTGPDFELKVADEAELKGIVDALNASPELKGFQITGTVGATREESKSAGIAQRSQLEAQGLRSPRKTAPIALAGTNAADVQFSEETAVSPVDPALAEELSALSPADYVSAVYRDPMGVWTAKGWNALPRKRYVVAIDSRGLKLANDTFGNEAGDRIIDGLKLLSTALGGQFFDFSHLHGDEFAFQSDNIEDVEIFLKLLYSKAAENPIEAIDPATGKTVYIRLQFRHGVGEGSYEAADKDFNRRKKLETAGSSGAAGAEPWYSSTRELIARGSGEERSVQQPEMDVRRGGRLGAGSEFGSAAESDPLAFGPATGEEINKTAIAEMRASARAWIGALPREEVSSAWAWYHYATGEATLRPPTPSDKIVGGLAGFGLVDPVGDLSADIAVERQSTPDALRLDVPTSSDAMTFSQTDEKKAVRGQLNIIKLATGRKLYDIALHPKADKSTFLHESAHVFLDMLGDFAEDPLVAQTVKADFELLLKELGVSSRSDITTKEHEIFAQGFEAYAMRGESPSPTLVSAFKRFQRWLLNVYKGAKSLSFRLSPGLTSVFDRMLATSEEFEAVREATGLHKAAFRSPEEAGMTPEEFRTYLTEFADGESFSRRRVELRAAKDQLREAESWWKEELANRKSGLAEAFEKMPVNRALRFVRTGEMIAETGEVMLSGTARKLDRDSVKKILGRESKLKASLLKSGGEDPATIGSMFGFSDPKSFLEAIEKPLQKSAWVNESADAAMREAHGDLLSNIEALRAEIAKGLFGDHNLKWLQREVVALQRKAKPNEAPQPIQLLKRAAEIIVERKRIGEIRPRAALAAERLAANRAQSEILKGNFAKALAHKREQILNMFIYRAMADVAEERDSNFAYAKKLTKLDYQKRLGMASIVYRDAVAVILGSLGLSDVKPLEVVPNANDIVRTLQSHAAEPGFEASELDFLLRQGTKWENMTVAEMRTVNAALRNIYTTALFATKVSKEEQAAELAEVVEQFVSEARTGLNEFKHVSPGVRTRTQEAKVALSQLDGSLLQPEKLFREWLGSGDFESAAFKYIVRPLQEAKAKEIDILQKHVEPILRAFDGASKELRALWQEPIDGAGMFPGHIQRPGPPIMRSEVFLMALHTGTPSSLERLTKGRGITESQVDAALRLLTKEEWDIISAIWQSARDLWPQMKALEERMTGVAPPALTERVIRTQFGDVQGGYFPAVYDSAGSITGLRQEATDIASIMDPSYSRPGTAHGHLKGRVEGFTGALSFDGGIITRHLMQAAHDLAFREPLTQAARILMHPRVVDVMQERLGESKQKQIQQWLKDVGGMRGEDGVRANMLARIYRALRGNIMVSALGFAIPNAIEDLSNIPAAVARTPIKSDSMTAAVAEFARTGLKFTDMAAEKSGELRTRRDRIVRELVSKMNDLTRSRGKVAKAIQWQQDHGFVFMEFSDRITSSIVFWAGYRQNILDGLDEKEAVSRAEAWVRDVFSGQSAVDKAPVLRDKTVIGSTLIFYGFLSNYYNGLRVLGHSMVGKERSAQAVIGARLVAYVLTVSVLAEALRGRGREKDKDGVIEPWEQWFARKTLSGLISSLPFGGDVSNNIDAHILGKKSNPRVMSLTGAAFDLGEALVDTLEDDVEVDRKIQGVVRALGPAAGVATSQPIRTSRYLYDISQGKDTPDDPFEFIGGAIRGNRPDRPSDFWQWASDTVSGEE